MESHTNTWYAFSGYLTSRRCVFCPGSDCVHPRSTLLLNNYREGLPRRAVKSGQVVDEPSTLLDTVGNHSSCHYIGFYSAWHGGITTAGVGVFHGGISRGSIVSLGTFSLEPGAAKGLHRNMYHAERPTCQRPVYMLPVHFTSIP